MATIRSIISLFIFSLLFPALGHAASLQIGRVNVQNVGIGKRLVRLNDSGIFLDDSGLCLEVSVNFHSSGLAGERVICLLHPLDADGNILGDQSGEAVSLGAVTIPTSNYNGTLVIPMPYQWVLADKDRKQSVSMGVSLACMGDESVGEDKIITLTEAEMNIDRNSIGSKMMSDVFGSPGDMMGGLFEGLLGGSDAEATQPCSACDGTGICPHCDGDAYFSPSACRKCSSDPGICRRCNGTGKVTVKYDFY